MSNDLVVSTGGAVAVPSTGTAVGEHLGDLSRDAGVTHEVKIADWLRQRPEMLLDVQRNIRRDLLIDGLGEELIDRCLSVARDYAAVLENARKRGDVEEASRIMVRLSDELVSKGILTLEQLERIPPILERYDEQAKRALNGPGANNSGLIEEMRALDSLMAKRESRYWKGPDADGLQRRWRELYDQGVRTDTNRR